MLPLRPRGSISMYVCSATNHFADVKALERFVAEAKKRGVKLPPQIEIAIAAAKSGRDVEAHLNAICNDLFKYYVDAQNACAVKAGFKSYGDMSLQQSTQWQRIDEAYDPCILAVERQYQRKSVERFFDPKAWKETFLKLWDNISPVVFKYIKKKALGAIRVNGGPGSSPGNTVPTSHGSPASSSGPSMSPPA